MDEYHLEEILQVDFPDLRRIITKVELLDYLLKRFVHSSLKEARVFNFKYHIREQKIQFYNKMEKTDSIPTNFEKIMKDQTLAEFEKKTSKGNL